MARALRGPHARGGGEGADVVGGGGREAHVALLADAARLAGALGLQTGVGRRFLAVRVTQVHVLRTRSEVVHRHKLRSDVAAPSNGQANHGLISGLQLSPRTVAYERLRRRRWRFCPSPSLPFVSAPPSIRPENGIDRPSDRPTAETQITMPMTFSREGGGDREEGPRGGRIDGPSDTCRGK